MREQQGILEQAPTKHKAVLFVNVKVYSIQDQELSKDAISPTSMS